MIEKLIFINKWAEHCALCDICLMPESNNCQGLDYTKESYYCEICERAFCNKCVKKHDKYCKNKLYKI